MRKFFVLAFAVFALVGWAVQSNAAQTADVCPQFIANALEAVGNSCMGLGRNSACYGYDRVEATFDQATAESFSQPSDLADLFNLRTISTTPLRTTLNEWGISLLSVQANLPDSLPGQNVIFMLAGDVEAESAVDPATLAEPDAEETPMQAFYFRTGIGQTSCLEAPDTMMVQGPRGVEVDFNANGADIRIGSTIGLRTYPVDSAIAAQIRSQYGISDLYQLMELIVFDGEAILDVGTPNEKRVPEGYHALRCLAQPEDLGIDGEENDTPVFDGCPWLDIRPLYTDEIQRYAGYDGFTLIYPINIPDGVQRPIVANVPTLPSAPTVPSTAIPSTPVPTSDGGSPTYEPTDEPTETVTPPINVPPELFLDGTAVSMIPRDNFYLTGTYNDPDDDVLFMDVDWGDSLSDSYILGGSDGGEVGVPAGAIRLAAGAFNLYHSYDVSGLYEITVTLTDSADNRAVATRQAHTAPLTPLNLSIDSGDGQHALPNDPFMDPLVVWLTDNGGAVVPDQLLFVNATNATTNATCDGGICYVITDANGIASLNATAGATIGAATVGLEDASTGEAVTFNLSVIDPSANQPPTIDIQNDAVSTANGSPFELDYNINDPDLDTLEVSIYWGDADLPEVITDLSSGSYFRNHEFAAAGQLTILVEVSDGEFTASQDYVLDVIPLYPLALTNTPLTGWTGTSDSGQQYPGTIRISVADASSDPVFGIPLLSGDAHSIQRIDTPDVAPVTVSAFPGGYAHLRIVADCITRPGINIGAPDPVGGPLSGLPGTYSYTNVDVNQVVAYRVIVIAGGDQTTNIGSEFALPVKVELRNSGGTLIPNAPITYEIFSVDGATFKNVGGTVYNTTTDGGGHAISDIIRGGGAETFTVRATYTDGFCDYSAETTLTVEPMGGPISPVEPPTDGDVSPEITPEVTDEVVNPEVTPEATDEAEATEEPVNPEVTDEAVNPEVTDEAVNPEVTDEPDAPEATDEAVAPVSPTPTHTPTAIP